MENDISAFKSRFQRLAELREERDITKKQADKAEKAYRSYEAELYEELIDTGIRGGMTFDFGGDLGVISFSPRKPTIYGRVIDREAAIAALKSEGKDEVIFHEAVREGRLNELVRDYMETHKELPDGIDWYDRKGITISRK